MSQPIELPRWIDLVALPAFNLTLAMLVSGLVVWAMNYMIIISPLPVVGEELAPFLQRAQLARYRERNLLGPYHFAERSLHYQDRGEGGLDLFQGETVISYSGSGNENVNRPNEIRPNDVQKAVSSPLPERLSQQQPIFRMSYCGGLVR